MHEVLIRAIEVLLQLTCDRPCVVLWSICCNGFFEVYCTNPLESYDDNYYAISIGAIAQCASFCVTYYVIYSSSLKDILSMYIHIYKHTHTHTTLTTTKGVHVHSESSKETLINTYTQLQLE